MEKVVLSGDGGSPEYNLKILVPVARYLREKRGIDALAGVCEAAQLEPADFENTSGRWVSSAQFEAVLAATRALVDSDDEFKAVCSYRSEETYGPLRFLTWAATPELVYAGVERSNGFFSTVGTFKVVTHASGSAVLQYRATRTESRLVCLSRQAQMVKVPLLWDMPPAHLEEVSCIARGGECCEYRFRWYRRRRLWPALLGAAAGGVATWVAAQLAPEALPFIGWMLPLFGGCAAQLLEGHRTEASNRETQTAAVEALNFIVNSDAEARRELLAFHQRQLEWTRMLEEASAERNSALQGLASRFRQNEVARQDVLRGFSHDLRNPLSVVVGALGYCRQQAFAQSGEGKEVIDDLQDAVNGMHRLLHELMVVVGSSRKMLQHEAERFEVAPIAERLRRRLRALVHGRDIRVTAFSTREAPAFVYVDPLVFDRIIDNLLTNAAKYTERGSIVVEVDGNPTMLVIKISDTGRGIASDDLERIFQADGSDASSRAKDSFGVGLSVVLDLLAQVGGRLEVMSKPGEGTTFWVSLPVADPKPAQATPALPEIEVSAPPPQQVLRIRRLA